MHQNFSDGYISIITGQILTRLSKLFLPGNICLLDIATQFFFQELGLVEVLEDVLRFLKERTYLKKEHYIRQDLDFKIIKTKPITKEPSLVLITFIWV